ncbi:hypothetical protein LG296_15140 [Ureibacillus chungkukjangi]|uniref:hypothetical protein n=1 Tax=Ureibacillus chungkukjangi TaxID=1202712 RepID=UPI00384E9459
MVVKTTNYKFKKEELKLNNNSIEVKIYAINSAEAMDFKLDFPSKIGGVHFSIIMMKLRYLIKKIELF